MISTTVFQDDSAVSSEYALDEDGEALLGEYHNLLTSDSVTWAAEYRKIRVLGKGGQGVVYLSERQGTDLFRLPVALKDNFCTAGIKTTCASRILGDWRPPYDATVTRRLIEAGACLVGNRFNQEVTFPVDRAKTAVFDLEQGIGDPRRFAAVTKVGPQDF